ncbi:alpha/beta hydrolase [Streptomyces camponoticapitis]|uniref:Alpha/beta hydrolase n=1 Tax=Streptomyces camponoticapitis TaxID=1616125 RepID=A0ABQ2E2U5_9ACTN|nr:alpha/beta fold hydrolase [Streptomyces camponoticapitis]GGJ91145.1 alpha/beta hydrolase [Streptomyces camponoticapitis]
MSSYRQPGVVLRDHRFSVPLDHANPSGERIELYGREAVAASKADADLPWLLYLEGGPGFGARRFIGKQAWLGRALEEFRVLHLDQRGTGFSTPLNRQTLPALGGPRQQADHLALFRSDNIVRDCEAIRPQLTGGAPWTVLGQSFGGFCAVRYLSTAPEGLRTVLITGGLPSLDAGPDDIYRAAYPRIERKVAAHYARYPQDVERARRIVDHIAEHRPVLPNGYRLTPEGFQSLGILLGTGDGTHLLHQLLDNAFVRTAAGYELSDAFQEKVAAELSFAGHPLYALVHEAIYAQDDHPTAWSAERVRAEFPRFDAERALAGDTPLLFTGETIHPWHFTSDPSLRPLRETAELLAARTDWPALYDRSRLATNEVPVAAAVYHDDMYVDTGHALETARAVRGLRTWVTDEYEHDGVRVSGPRVLDRLLGLARGEI